MIPRIAAAIVCVLAVAASESHAEPLANLVIIFIDDLGYADVRPFGQPAYPTPNVARMANEGRSCTDFQVSSAVCSASRGVLTGCYHPRVGIHGALGPRVDGGINAEETTLADLCRGRGYATACVGTMWHGGIESCSPSKLEADRGVAVIPPALPA